MFRRFHRTVLPALVLTCLACERAPQENAAGESKVAQERGRPPRAAAHAGPNVLLITIDTLRADHLPMYGYRGVTTPHLSRLAKEGVVFEDCASHAPITLPSHTTLLTGLYPPEHGVRANGTHRADPSLHTLTEVLQGRGYRTAAFVSAFVLDSRYGLDQGFSHYDDDLEDGRQRWSVFGVKDRRAQTTVDRLLAWLDEQKPDKDAPPFFLWLHLYDPHFEYDPPEPFRSLTPSLYDGEIAYTDHQLGRLRRALEARKLLDTTLIAVTADHGESLGDHGESTHSLFVYEATQHVPLILRLPGGKHGGRRVPGLVRHVDVAPTLVDYAGLSASEAEWLSKRSGSSLRAGIEGKPLPVRMSYAEAYLPHEQFGWAPLSAVRDQHHKYIEAPRSELYDLAGDPREASNLWQADTSQGAASPARRKLLLELASFRRRPRWESSDARHELDAEAQAKLKALGYVADETPDPAQAGADPKDMLAIYEAREQIHHAMNRGEYQQALTALEPILEKDPKNAGLWSDRAACLAELQQWKPAEAAYRRLAQLKPTSVAAHRGLAKVAFKGLHDFARAEKELAAAQALSPDDPSLHGLRGDLLHEKGDLQAAVKAYAKAVEGGDQTPSFFTGYASALNLTGQLEKAREVIERAVRMDQSSAIAHHNHGVILERMGLLAAAGGCYDEALHLEPRLIPSAVALAKLLERRGRRGQAGGVLQGSLKTSPESALLWMELGGLFLRGGQPDTALKHMERAVKLAPEDPATRTQLAFAHASSGDLDEAYTEYTRILALLPKESPERCATMLRLARIRVAESRTDAARDWVAQAVQCGGEPITEQVRHDPQLSEL